MYSQLLIYFRWGVIPILADILADAQKEKVSRIILAVFRVSLRFVHHQYLIHKLYMYVQNKIKSLATEFDRKA